MRIGIFYFSGTGNTEIVAKMFRDEFGTQNEVFLYPIEKLRNEKLAVDPSEFDLIGLGSAIHAFNAPRIVWDFVNSLPQSKATPLFYFKCPANVRDHGGATIDLRVALTKRGYKVVYEAAIRMPSNFMMTDDTQTMKDTFQKARQRVKRITTDILGGRVVRQKNPTSLRLKTRIISFFERYGARMFGRHLQASKACTRCGLCASKCPMENIIPDRKKHPRFGSDCLMCMRCVYLCPEHAISPKFAKFTMVRGGYHPLEIYKDMK